MRLGFYLSWMVFAAAVWYRSQIAQISRIFLSRRLLTSLTDLTDFTDFFYLTDFAVFLVAVGLSLTDFTDFTDFFISQILTCPGYSLRNSKLKNECFAAAIICEICVRSLSVE